MCPQPSLPVVPGDSAASRSSDRNEKPKTAKKPAIVLGPKKPTRKNALAPRPPDPVALQHPKRVDQKVCLTYSFFVQLLIHHFSTGGSEPKLPCTGLGQYSL